MVTFDSWIVSLEGAVNCKTQVVRIWLASVFSLAIPALSSCSAPSVAQDSPVRLRFTDIAHVYHGAPVDREFKVIELDRRKIGEVLDSMIESLSVGKPELELADGSIRPPRAPAMKAAEVENLKQLFAKEKIDPLLSKIALVRAAIRTLPPVEARVYRERLDVLRQAAYRLSDIVRPKANAKTFPAFSGSLALAEEATLAPSQYIEDCRSAGVPIPPNWPNAAWIDRGPLPAEFTFASFPGTVSSAVFTFEASDGSGFCYALPRKSAAGSIEAMGVICQAKASGRACFFDNLDAAGARITGQTIAIDFTTVKNGYSLEENCTDCHRGGNAFMIHPKTPLGAIRNRDPDVRYSPIGQANWSNPPPLADWETGECAACHEIAAVNGAYCGFLRQASNKTMPSPTSVAGWDNPKPEYSAHIAFLKSACAAGP